MMDVRVAVEKDGCIKEPGTVDQGASTQSGLDDLWAGLGLGFEAGEDLKNDFGQSECAVRGTCGFHRCQRHVLLRFA